MPDPLKSWGMPETTRQQKITFGGMRKSGVNRVLIYCSDRLIEIANSVEAVQDGRIFIELINWPFLHDLKGSPADTRPASIWR